MLSVFSGITAHPITWPAVISLVVSILLLCISAIISASEVAYFSLDPQQLDSMHDSDNKSEKRVVKLLDKPQRLLATILIGNNFVNVSIILLLTVFTNSILNFDQSPLIGFIFQTIIITFLLLLFGEIMPKIYATQNSRKVASAASSFLSFLETIFSPFVSLLVNSTSIVNNRLAKHAHSNISMDELSQALELTSNSTDEDTDILEGIIKFGNIHVVDIMTSRVDVVDVDIKTGYKQLLEMIIRCGYSRIPVYSGSRDNIKGVLYSKDLLPHLDKPATFRWQSLIRQAYYVPETKKIDDLLSEFQKNHVHLAIVIDEYGGASGLVTLEDILEEIVGDIADEHDIAIQGVRTEADGSIVVDGSVPIRDLNRALDWSLPDEEATTVAGLVIHESRSIPEERQAFTFYGKRFIVMKRVKNRITRLRIRPAGDLPAGE